VNLRARKAALHVIGIIALLASVDALAHSYAGLYSWALHHRLSGWQAMSWPAEIDAFLAVGELALYVAYLDSWPARQRLWPWAAAAAGLAVSVAGNVGHIVELPREPVTMADRLTAAASPVAAFAGLIIGLLVLKMMRHAISSASGSTAQVVTVWPVHTCGLGDPEPDGDKKETRSGYLDRQLLADAVGIMRDAAASGHPVSQRALAATLRERGYRFSNAQLRSIVSAANSGIDRATSREGEAPDGGNSVRGRMAGMAGDRQDTIGRRLRV
jgi:hypothetical protein